MTPRHVRFRVPGSDATLDYRYGTGGLAELRCGSRVHVLTTRDALGRPVRTYGGDLAAVTEHRAGGGLARGVRTLSGAWTEAYRWDDRGRLAHVDGVDIERDERGRVTACTGPAVAWRYAYSGRDLVAVTGPHGVREIARDAAGRARGARDAATPLTWHRDRLGRLWTVRRDDGTVAATYLWQGLSCLGRIDGPPGDPLAAVFSLDPGGTPVRVVTRDGVIRVPRDAFGEALLDHPGVPGLYGGAVHGGLVHLPLRRLDPRTGSFTTADPYDGSPRDPRRASGFRGALPSETPAAGAYAACRNDPVGRADPSGGMSALVTLSDFTWSFQNTLLSWLGLDWTINFWTSLFTEPLEFFGDWEGVTASPRVGVSGLRRGGFMAKDSAFTYQHLVFANESEFADLDRTWAVVPDAPFTPVLLGSALRVVPDGAAAFLLGGDRSLPTLRGWTRGGGPAAPVVPGSRVPSFPSGGLHLDSPIATKAGGACTLGEIVPAGEPVTGTVSTRTLLTAQGTGLGVATGSFVLVQGPQPPVLISDVVATDESDGRTTVTLRDEATGIVAPVRLRGLGAGPVSTETVNAAADRLDVTGTAGAYQPGDALRLRHGTTIEGSVLVDRLEAQLTIDAALPADVGPGFTVHTGTLGGSLPAARGAAADDLVFVTGAPGRGDAIEVTNGVATVHTVVMEQPDATRRVVDVDLTAAGLPPNLPVTWRPIAAANPRLGVHAGDAEPGTALTYAPDAVRTAPASGYVVLIGPSRNAVRTVTARVYDVLVPHVPLPNPTAAPYDTDRFVVQPSPDLQGMAIATRLLLATAVPLNAPGAVSLRMQQWAQTALAALLPSPATAPGVTVTGRRVTGLPAGVSVAAGQVVAIVSGGAAPRPATVSGVVLTVELDRPVDALGEPLAAVGLTPAASVYDAERLGDVEITVLPNVVTAGRTQLPRFAPGETVRVSWTPPATPAGARTSRVYSVVSVDGTTLTLAGPRIPDTATDNVTDHKVERLVPADPVNGSARLAVAGRVDPANPARVTFTVWTATALAGPASTGAAGTILAVTDGTVTTAAEVVSVTDQALDLSAPPGDGTYDLSVLSTAPAQTLFSASFTQDEGVLVPDTVAPPSPLVPGPGLVVVTAFGPAAAPVPARLSSGTVRVPEAAETFEVSRRQSLTDHELTHTIQSARLGPVLLGMFPLFLLEALFEGTSDVELPEFSPSVAATVEVDRSGVFLTITGGSPVAFAAGDRVQVSRGGSPPVTVTLRAGTAPARFRLESTAFPAGAVSVRKHLGTGANTAWDVILDAGGVLTHGGAMNVVGGLTWGSFAWVLVKAGNALSRWRSGTGAMFPATVEQEGTAVRVAGDAVAALRGATWLVVQQGGSTLVRAVREGGDDTLKVLSSSVSFRGDVTVGVHTTLTPGSGANQYDFFPAVVEDPSRPAALRVHQVGERRLDLHVDDRVEIQLERSSTRTRVVHAEGDHVELSDPVLTTGQQQREVRIAKYAETDPMGSLDSAYLEWLGMGWMRWLFDPLGQLQYRTHADPRSAWGITARTMRYAMGTQTWSAIFPGWFLLDNVWERWFDAGGHLSEMEQEASQESGDLYSPIGRLRAAPAVVGDIGRYWFHSWDGRSATIYRGNRRDAPDGVALRQYPLLMPAVTPEVVPPPGTLNQGAATPPAAAASATSPADPGGSVPDELVVKAADRREPTAVGPRGFLPSDRGWIPLTAETERSCGRYLAFSRPGTHRVSVSDGIGDPTDARQAHDDTKLGGGTLQTIFFTVAVADVAAVRIGGVTVTEGTPLRLVVTQRAGLVVTVPPSAATAGEVREWVVDLTRNTGGPFVRTDGRAALLARAVTPADVPAEVARRYEDPAGDRSYFSGGLAGQGVHLGGDVHVPIREFAITVVDTISLRSTLDWDPAAPDAAAITQIAPGGTAFLVVPAAVLTPPAVVPVNYPGTTTPVAPTITAGPAPSGVLAEHVGGGQVYQVTFPATPAPSGPVTVEIRVGTWDPSSAATPASPGAVTATLRARVDLTP